jgi:hypothetical protein
LVRFRPERGLEDKKARNLVFSIFNLALANASALATPHQCGIS